MTVPTWAAIRKSSFIEPSRTAKDMGAVMDGNSHPLSDYFGSLAAAQVEFPHATALSNEIDWAAIQLGINLYNAVIIPSGTALVNKVISLPAGGQTTVLGLGMGVSKIALKSGSNATVMSSADDTALNPRITISGLSIDGNKAGNSGTSLNGLRLYLCENLTLEDIEAHDCAGQGVTHRGFSPIYTRVQSWRNIFAHDNTHWGVNNGTRTRQVTYDHIVVARNGSNPPGAGPDRSGGFLLDHSESRATSVHAYDNSGDGIFIRNVSSCNVSGLRATGNGRHGITVAQFVDSYGSDWLAQSNGVTDATGNDVNMEGGEVLTPGYGVTGGSLINGVVAGPNRDLTDIAGYPNSANYAIYVEDGDWDNGPLRITNALVTAGDGGTVRLPAVGDVTVATV